MGVAIGGNAPRGNSLWWSEYFSICLVVIAEQGAHVVVGVTVVGVTVVGTTAVGVTVVVSVVVGGASIWGGGLHIGADFPASFCARSLVKTLSVTAGVVSDLAGSFEGTGSSIDGNGLCVLTCRSSMVRLLKEPHCDEIIAWRIWNLFVIICHKGSHIYLNSVISSNDNYLEQLHY